MSADVGVVLAAGGAGRRFGGPKQFLELLERPLLHYSLDVFASLVDVAHIVVVLPPDSGDRGRELVAAWRRAPPPVASRPRIDTAPGGARRQDSVLSGLRALDERLEYALVHDAARPLLRPEEVCRLIAAVRAHGAAAVGIPTHDSLKRVREASIVEELKREEVWAVQTPQGARAAALREAYERAGEAEWTDEASALRALGLRVALVEGRRDNFKITRAEDLELAEAVLRTRSR